MQTKMREADVRPRIATRDAVPFEQQDTHASRRLVELAALGIPLEQAAHRTLANGNKVMSYSLAMASSRASSTSSI